MSGSRERMGGVMWLGAQRLGVWMWRGQGRFGGMEYGTFTFLQGGPCAGVINAIGGLDESDGDFCANDERQDNAAGRVVVGAVVVAW